jgi:hypothetical protein
MSTTPIAASNANQPTTSLRVTPSDCSSADSINCHAAAMLIRPEITSVAPKEMRTYRSAFPKGDGFGLGGVATDQTVQS